MENKVQETSDFNQPSNDLMSVTRESEYLEMLRQLKLEVDAKTSECERLRIKLDDNVRDVEQLSQDLNNCRVKIVEHDENSKKNREDMAKSRKLEEDYVKLMSEFLDLGERSQQYRQTLLDKYLAKTNLISNLECLDYSGALRNELDRCRSELDTKTIKLSVSNAMINNLEEVIESRDRYIAELKKTLDDTKLSHRNEINVLEEYVQSLKGTIRSYEKTLADQSNSSTIEESRTDHEVQ